MSKWIDAYPYLRYLIDFHNQNLSSISQRNLPEGNHRHTIFSKASSIPLFFSDVFSLLGILLDKIRRSNLHFVELTYIFRRKISEWKFKFKFSGTPLQKALATGVRGQRSKVNECISLTTVSSLKYPLPWQREMFLIKCLIVGYHGNWRGGGVGENYF